MARRGPKTRTVERTAGTRTIYVHDAVWVAARDRAEQTVGSGASMSGLISRLLQEYAVGIESPCEHKLAQIQAILDGKA